MTTNRPKLPPRRTPASPSEHVGETNISSITPDAVRAELWRIWGAQACQHANDWPRVRQELIAKGYGGRVDTAVDELVRLFAPGAPTPDDAQLHRAFSPFTRESREALCAALSAMRDVGGAA